MEEQVKPECDKDNLDEQKREDYEKLLEGYNQYVESYNKLNEECAKMTTDRDIFVQTIKALEESKAESKVELKKVENQLQTEVASKKYLEKSLAKYRKIRQEWAIKVFQSDPNNEDLDNLLSLEPEKLFKKYEQIMKIQ